MSLIDPVALRRAAMDRRVGMTPGLVVALVVLLALWTLFGFGLADALSYPQSTLVVDIESQLPNTTPRFLWALFVGLCAALFVAAAVQPTLTRRFGLGSALATTSAAACLGISVGFWRGATTSWVVPTEVGTLAGTGTAAGEPWGTGAWIAYTAAWWIPALLVLLALLGIWRAVRNARATRRRADRKATMKATGSRTDGLVVDVRDTGIEIMDRPRFQLVVKFTDIRGTDRWVTRTELFDPAQLPRTGDPATVWYDPSNPGDEESIVISLRADGS